MKENGLNLTLATLVAILCGLAACSRQGAAPSSGVDIESAAVNLVDMMSTGDFSGVVTMFDATMKAALSEATLEQTWSGLAQQCGAFKSRGSGDKTSEAGYEVVYVPCEFENATLKAKVVFGSDGKVAGLFFQ